MNNKHKREIIYAFIDSQNLNLGTSKDLVKNGKVIYKGWSQKKSEGVANRHVV